MSEKKFLGFVFIEGIILTILGLCILILPKLTSLSFGVMLSSAFITYGIFKIVGGFISRHYSSHFLYNLFLGIFLTVIGILLLLVPRISLLWLVALTGVYFLLESISSSAFAAQIRNSFNMWGCKMATAIILFLVGLLIVVGLPSVAFWTVAILSGIAFLIKGMAKITLFLTNRNTYTI